MSFSLPRPEVAHAVLEDFQKAVAEDRNFRYWLIGFLTESFPSRLELQQTIQQIHEETERQIAAYREETDRQIAAFREEVRQEIAAYREETDRQIAAFREEVRQEIAAYREETDRRIEAFRQEMAEMRREFQQEMAALRRDFHRLETSIGALGARWGLWAEEAFRSGIAGILKDRLGWKVERFLAVDPEGFVFGHPDQVEIDVVIRDGVHWLAEIRSSMSKSDMYTFNRKVAFYEKLKGVKVDRRIVISPMVHPQAKAVAEQLGIEVYTSAYDVS